MDRALHLLLAPYSPQGLSQLLEGGADVSGVAQTPPGFGVLLGRLTDLRI